MLSGSSALVEVAKTQIKMIQLLILKLNILFSFVALIVYNPNRLVLASMSNEIF